MNEEGEDENHIQQQSANRVDTNSSLIERSQRRKINKIENDLSSEKVSDTDGSENLDRVCAEDNLHESFSHDNDDAISEEDGYEKAIKESMSKKKKASLNLYSYEFDNIIKGTKA